MHIVHVTDVNTTVQSVPIEIIELEASALEALYLSGNPMPAPLLILQALPC